VGASVGDFQEGSGHMWAERLKSAKIRNRGSGMTGHRPEPAAVHRVGQQVR
jgi:hypothetical protein